MANEPRNSDRLRIGLVLPTWSGSLDGLTPTAADIVALARRAEEVGFDSVWVVDTLLLPELGYWECWSLLAAIAQATRSLTLGSLVTSANYRNPALLARTADTIDDLSGGRLVLGIGAGDAEGAHRALGFPWDGRFGRLEESLSILRMHFSQGTADLAGKHFRVSQFRREPRGLRAFGPPLMVGSYPRPGPRMCRMIAEYADMWNAWLAFDESSPEVIAAALPSLRAALNATGRDPASLRLTAAVGVQTRNENLHFGPWDIADGAISGPPAEIAAALQGFADVGLDEVQVYTDDLSPKGLDEFREIFDRIQ